MTDSIREISPFAQSFAVDGLPTARPLTRDDLEKIQDALEQFKKALAAWELRRDEQHRKATSRRVRPGDEEPASDGQKPPAEQALSPDAFHCLIVTGYLGKGQGLEKDTEEAVFEACARHLGARLPQALDGDSLEPRLERIHLILDSAGGSLDAAYKVILGLRNYAKDVWVYVPRRAKSAATLIAIGADQIVMAPHAELGPLDTQINDPRNPSTRVSALDCYRSVDYVREFGIQAISRALKVMLDETQNMLPLSQLIDSATAFAIGSVRPMLEQVKALDFGAWGRTLRIGETYAKALRLRLRHPDREEDAERLATKLVYGYPHHPYPIDRTEAKSLGLAVETMPTDVYQAAKVITAACKGGSRFVGFSEDLKDAIKQSAEPREGTPTPARSVPAQQDGSPQGVQKVDPDS